ncbi:MAG: hypothetical protein IM624_02545 [Phenylobacterium sp.]|jgi:hypothetical protein|uniref:hypothetical protein n=1 Tax=Phenylobacterium sp. TaxID=1871053 RepID=UPI0025FFC490|nr:hypothetical protein [Phenylobacterium sp.]MCA6295960.1 hypothetical protein [Phenylobacterium sp.]MCA6298059.1 hypothetical protein [Phenylobacterium sp.]
MTLEGFLLEGAPPQHIDEIREIVARWSDAFPPQDLARLNDVNVYEVVTGWLEAPGVEDSAVLMVASDLTALARWRGRPAPAVVMGRLNALTRPILTRISDSLSMTPRPLSAAHLRRAHVLFVGALQDPTHAPSQPAVAYAAALARDPKVERIEIVHSGDLTSDMRDYIHDELGGFPASRGIALISTADNPDFLADVFARGPCTFHFWYEPALSPVISVVSRLGPTLMFVDGDDAPVQYADVYWSRRSEAEVRDLWGGQGAPAAFAANHVQVLQCPARALPAPEPLPRAALGLAEEALVIATVGDRLEAEMDESYITGIELVIRDRPSCVWMVAGALPDYLSDAFQQVLGPRFLHIPEPSDLARLMTTVDIYANPFRSGGGRGADLAATAGASVLTLDRGEVAGIAPPDFLALDAEDYLRRLDALIAVPELLAALKARQAEHLAQVGDQKALLSSLQKMVRTAAQRYAERGNGLPLSQTVFAPQGAQAGGG